MAQPTPYNRNSSFTNDQTQNPTTKTPGNWLDVEFNSVLTTFPQVLANLGLIQRDDGQIANSTIGLAQLKAEVSTGVAPATTWVTALAARVGANNAWVLETDALSPDFTMAWDGKKVTLTETPPEPAPPPPDLTPAQKLAHGRPHRRRSQSFAGVMNGAWPAWLCHQSS
jgi:hypothetical protein